MLVAIHQPNFLPWLGWFDKLARCDVFILLDTAAHQHSGSNYTNRVQVLLQGQPHWLTVPVTRSAEARGRIDQLRVAADPSWRRKLRATLTHAYARAPYFAQTMPTVDAMLALPTDNLCDLNLAALFALADALGLPRERFVRASTLPEAGVGTARLVSLVRAVGGDAYLTGNGADGYQQDDLFAAAGIAVHFQRYVPPAYPQSGAAAFVPGLSALDALMQCGPDAAALIGAHAREIVHA